MRKFTIIIFATITLLCGIFILPQISYGDERQDNEVVEEKGAELEFFSDSEEHLVGEESTQDFKLLRNSNYKEVTFIVTTNGTAVSTEEMTIEVLSSEEDGTINGRITVYSQAKEGVYKVTATALDEEASFEVVVLEKEVTPIEEEYIEEVKEEYIEEVKSVTLTGFVEDEGGTRYYSGSNEYYKSTWKVIDGATYFFTHEGYRVENKICYIGSEKYGFNSDGHLLYGIVAFQGENYYFDEETGAMVHGEFVTTNGQKYFISGNGTLSKHTGFGYVGTTSYYFNGDGTVFINGIKEINGDKYGFDSNGIMYVSTFATMDNKVYFFGSNGKATKHKGVGYVGSNKYYFLGDGTIATGFVTIEGEVYGFKPDGSMYSGEFAEFNNKIYFFGYDGKATKYRGLGYVGNDRYFFEEGGFVAVGFIQDKTKNYYANPNSGKIYINTFVDVNDGKRYYAIGDGSLVGAIGFAYVGADVYYFTSDGSVQKGFAEIDGKKYYFEDNTGAMLRSCFKKVNDKVYFFTSYGYATSYKGYGYVGQIRYYFYGDGTVEGSQILEHWDVSANTNVVNHNAQVSNNGTRGYNEIYVKDTYSNYFYYDLNNPETLLQLAKDCGLKPIDQFVEELTLRVSSIDPRLTTGEDLKPTKHYINFEVVTEEGTVVGTASILIEVVDQGLGTFASSSECYDFLYKLNAYRAAHGLSAVSWDANLQAYAERRCISQQYDFNHTFDADGSLKAKSSIFSEYPYTGYMVGKGENIGIGHTSVDDILTGWKNSPGHNALLLHSSIRTVGFSKYQRPDEIGSITWTMIASL